MLVGACWTIQWMLPWTNSGLLATSSQVDGFRLLRSGVVSSAPSWAAYLLLVLPVVGLALLALAGLGGRWPSRIRVVLAALGLVMLAGIVHVLVSFDVTRLGLGGWTATTGAVLAVVASVLDHSTRSEPTHSLEVVP